MRTHTNEFKNDIKEFGREIDSKLTYNNTVIDNEDLYNVTPILHTELLKSVMKGLNIETKVDIPIGSQINYQFGIKARENNVQDYRDNYDYIDYGNYIVKESEYNEANENYTLKCYDKMLYSMKEYTTLQSAEFPLTVREYIGALCSDLDLDFANANDTFVNYDKVLQTDPYANINYTYRDIFDDLSEATASNICINNDDELEVRYINETQGNNLFTLNYLFSGGITINDEMLNDFTYTNAWATQYISNANVLSIFEPNTTYYCKFKFKVINRPASFGQYNTETFFLLYNGSQSKILGTTPLKNTGELNTWYDIETSFTTPNDLTNYRILAYNYKDASNNTTGTIQISNFIISKDDIAFEPYGADCINEEYLKDINVKFGEKFGAVNTIVLSRSADSDKIARSIPADLADEDKVAITIRDNQIMNDDNREEYIDGILNQLNGLEFYLNDYTSTGITYLEACDKYNVSANGSFYPCIMFNDEVNITQGLVEQIDTPMPETSETEYKYVTPTDKIERTTSLILDKVNSRITAQAETIEIIATNIDKETGDVNAVTTKQKRFTFNDEGLRISAGENGYNSLSDETGTYYYDGTSKVGEYTKDGSKQKDLSLFGAYKYGMDDIDDTPMFVAQMYTNNGEEAFGHFYNRDV